MFLRWSEVLIRRAGLVLVLGVLATILAGVYGAGVFDKLGQGGFDDPSSEAAKELAHEQDVFDNLSADVIAIYRSKDLNALGMIANIVRERKNGNIGTYIHNLYVNYSNHCILRCQFCAFGARKTENHAFELTIDEIVRRVQRGLEIGITEVHMVGGLHPSLKPR